MLPDNCKENHEKAGFFTICYLSINENINRNMQVLCTICYHMINENKNGKNAGIMHFMLSED